MITADIKSLFEKIVDDAFSETETYILMSQAKNMIEDERPWEFLKKEDTSQTASTGDVYTTMKSLPSDFRYDRRLFLAQGSAFHEYFPISFEERRAFKDEARRYYVDFTNSQFALTGRIGQSGAIHLFYIRTTTDFTTANTSAEPVWPARFHPSIAYKMAEIYQSGIDADEIAFRMSVEQRRQLNEFMRAMRWWDDQLKPRAMNHQTTYFDAIPYVSVGNMDPTVR